ncbi:hypothetical protein ACQY0O_008219 [Thecaphora frezii]
MSTVAAVGLQVAAGTLLTYPYELCDLSYKANYQPLLSSPSASSTSSSTHGVKLTSLFSTLKHHLFTSPQGAFELFRGVLPYLAYTVTYSTFFPAYLSLFRRIVPAPVLGVPTGVVWRDALPFEAHQTLAVSTWRVLLQPLTTFFYRVLLAPGSRKLAPILPSLKALWNATTYTVALPSPSSSSSSSQSVKEAKQTAEKAATRVSKSGIASLLLPSVSLLEFAHGIVSGAANLVIAQAGLPILTYIAPHHFPASPRGFGFDLLNASVWALGGVALRLSALALRTVAIRLSVQDIAATNNNNGSQASDSEASEKRASQIALRPTRYAGIRDAFASIVREEGASALVRGWVVALVFDTVAVSSTLALAAASVPQMIEGPRF